jgi:FkbM family methyltransferase
MKRIREFLKRLLPPPVKSFMREVKNILEAINVSKKEIKVQIEKLSKETASIQNRLDMQYEELKRLYTLFESVNRENLRIFVESKSERERVNEEIVERLVGLEQNIPNVVDSITSTKNTIENISKDISKLVIWVPERNIYNNDYERRVTLSFKEYRRRPDFPNKLLNLLRGLDEESAETVVKILTRQEKIWDTEGESIDILSDEEDKQLRFLKQHLYSNILKISEDIYCYKNYLLPINHFEPCVFVYHYGLDRIKDKSRFANKCIIDVGAFIGDSALILSPLTSSKVYAFEATSKYYDLLQQTIKLNNLKNVVPVHAALGATCGRTEINVANSSSSILKPYIDSEGKEEVELITLDSFVKKHDLEVGLIKVDIEGYEQEFLKGAENTIKKQKPTLIVSIYHNPDDFFTIKPTIDNWKLGYKFKVFKPSDFSISREVILIAEAFD